MHVRKTQSGYYLRLETGNEIIFSLQQFAKDNDVRMASFTMMGAVTYAELGYFTLSQKQYHWKEFSGEFEILASSGNISIMQEEPLIHLHTTLSGADFLAFGGHVKHATVGATREIIVFEEKETLERAFDEKSGLNLWKI